MTIAKIETTDNGIELSWNAGGNAGGSNGGSDRFHFVWLRDHLPDPAFFDTQTGERLIDAHDYLESAKPEAVRLTSSGDLEIHWPGLPAPTLYKADWLRANAYSDNKRAARASLLPGPESWPWQQASEVRRHDYAELMEAPASAWALLADFKRYGFAVIEHAPDKEGVVAALTQWLGYTREVAFGLVREIKSEPETLNVAFTSRLVKPHIDGTNYIYPYEVQFLHCLANEAEGGDSWIVDGYGAAERLRQEDPAAFETLSEVPVDYVIGAGGHDIRHSAPIIELGRDGAVSIMRYSNAQRRVMSLPYDDVERFYAAYGKLSRIVNDPEHQIPFRFRPGDVLMFDNHRALHARGAFKPETGRRHLQLATTDRDMVDSMMRRLAKDLRRNEDLAAILPQTP